MTILSETHLLILHSEGFSINTNILETNVINQAILIGGLFFVWNSLNVGTALLEKQNRKISLVQDSEKRLNEAVTKLAETKKQLSQAQVIILEIQKETKQTKNGKKLKEREKSVIRNRNYHSKITFRTNINHTGFRNYLPFRFNFNDKIFVLFGLQFLI
jgi:hypothetical protein